MFRMCCKFEYVVNDVEISVKFLSWGEDVYRVIGLVC